MTSSTLKGSRKGVDRDASTPVTSTNWRAFAGSGNRYETNRAADGSSTLSFYQNGRLVSVTRKDNAGTQIGQTTNQYDPHGRLWKVTDALNGTTIYAYNNANQIVSATTPAPGTGQSPQTTLTYFNTMLQGTKVVQPDGTSVTNEFYSTGLLRKTAGSRIYPVGYSYDAQGRLKTMTNWSSFPSTGARVTTWNYDANRGWLESKRYPDNAGPNYTYSNGGKLATRTWARGITTTYTHNNAGELASVSYSGSTPTVTTVYDRRSRPSTVTQGGNTWNLFHNLAGQLLSEAGSAGVQNGLAVTNTYDTWLRRTILETKNGGSQLTSHGYVYNGASRLTNATDGSYSAGYTYLANSPLVSQIVFKQSTTTRMTTTKQYDLLNRLSFISSTPSSASPISFAYTLNDANQRIRSTLADSSYWIYQYDNLGQVKSGKRYWGDGTPVAGQQFEYAFDDIGNRTSTKAGGDAVGASLRVAAYAANTLNQITQRDVPGTVDIIGAATATATNVNVNDQSAYRHGEYYQVALSINNSSSPQWQSVTNRAVQNGTTNAVTGNVFLPKTPELFSHDADGNLTNDGRWAYVWDAENRLLSMTAPSAVPTGARLALSFDYDWQGRRVSKIVSNWTGSAWTRVLHEKYLYDAWNLLTALNGTNTALIKSFLWGSDLSGTMQGAGGVGGLLAVNDAANGVHFAAYDGNGNVAALVNAADGTVSASYEYGAFAEPIRITGTMGKANPFRFSTKYQDDETDAYYYGYRYLSNGRWLSRDPIEERGGVSLYCFVGNNAIDDVDAFGLDRWSWIEAERQALESHVKHLECCGCSTKPKVKGSIAGTSSGRQVTETVTVTMTGPCQEFVEIEKYYWWDCFTAQREYDKDRSPNKPRGKQAWQDYGWHEGGATQSQSETGTGPNFDYYDSNHWNWQAAVLYIYCGKDGHYHAGLSVSNAEEWTWDKKTKSWGSPHDGGP